MSITSEATTGRYIVRYGQMRFLGEFVGIEPLEHSRGDQVVVSTERGTELGEVLCPATEKTAIFLERPLGGTILRLINDEDRVWAEQLKKRQDHSFQVCLDLVSKHRLQLKLVDVEAILGDERLVFYYLAEKRVDFRELVKDLARVFQTRIEMRQIGVRDEAKLLADYGDCGKPVCCNTHLSKLPPVSMKMAKIQKATLDPTKVSGRCGRLKCCLRYEYDTYRTLERELPRIGATVELESGIATVLDRETLTGKLVVELEDGRRMIVESAAVRHGGSDHRALLAEVDNVEEDS
jgi:cell fate regulator YaaT (PSP1 superfamily)